MINNTINVTGLEFATPGSNCQVIASEVIRDYSQAIDSTIIKFLLGIVFCWIIAWVYVPFFKDINNLFYLKSHKTILWILKRISGIALVLSDFLLLFILGVAYIQDHFSDDMMIFIIFNAVFVFSITLLNVFRYFLSGRATKLYNSIKEKLGL